MSSGPKTYKPSSIDLEYIEFVEPRANKTAGFTSYIKYNHPNNYNKNKKLYVELPKMICPFGVSAPMNFGDETEFAKANPKMRLNMSFRGEENNEKLKEFKAFLEKLEDKIVITMMENESWKEKIGKRGKKLTKESVLDFLYNSCIKYSKNSNYPPTFVSTFYIREKDMGNNRFKIFDKSKQMTRYDKKSVMDLLPKGCEVKTIVDFTSIWISGSKFGLTSSLEQGKVYALNTFTSYSFQDDSDDEEDEKSERSEEEEEEDDDVLVDDSDNEEDDDESEEKDEVKPTKSKRGRKKSKVVVE